MDMYIEIDFSSDEALYIQLRNQIILGIATNRFHEGDVLPSVRQLADTIGINMHTVNKAYTVLKQEGYVKVDRRKGAVIAGIVRFHCQGRWWLHLISEWEDFSKILSLLIYAVSDHRKVWFRVHR